MEECKQLFDFIIKDKHYAENQQIIQLLKVNDDTITMAVLELVFETDSNILIIKIFKINKFNNK